MRCCSTPTTSCCRRPGDAAQAGRLRIRERECFSAPSYRCMPMDASELRLPSPFLSPRQAHDWPGAICCRSASRYRTAARCFAVICCCSGPIRRTCAPARTLAVFAYLLVSAPVADHQTSRWRASTNMPTACGTTGINEEERAATMTSGMFAGLPAECQSLRKRYAAQRYLSLFRGAAGWRQGDGQPLLSFRLRLSPLQALRWTYLRKAIRVLLKPVTRRDPRCPWQRP
jgi:hypothetical protein